MSRRHAYRMLEPLKVKRPKNIEDWKHRPLKAKDVSAYCASGKHSICASTVCRCRKPTCDCRFNP